MKCANCDEDIELDNYTSCDGCGIILCPDCQNGTDPILCDDCQLENDKFNNCEGKGI